ncbi:MAG: hypothetical protein ABIG39_01650 [Candidatus Micrarchaeota archaeon]
MEYRYLACVLLAVAILGCASSPAQPQGGNGVNVTNTTDAPVHTPGGITEYLQKHLVIEYGLWNVEVPQPKYSSEMWSTDVTVFTDRGGRITLRMIVNDSSLSVDEMWQRIYPNKEPVGIQNIEGKISCSDGKIRVMEFANPYCANCVVSEKASSMFRRKFNGSIEYEYRVILPNTNSMIEEYGYHNVSLTSKYYACVQNQSLLGQFRECVIDRYLKEVGKPLAENQLDSCAIDGGVDLDELKTCLLEGDRLLNWDQQLGQTYLGSSATLPTFVIDCRFKTSNPNLIIYAICYEFPETEGC